MSCIKHGIRDLIDEMIVQQIGTDKIMQHVFTYLLKFHIITSVLLTDGIILLSVSQYNCTMSFGFR